MSASQAPAQSAIAFQLATALEAYGDEVGQLLHSPLDAGRYQAVTRRMDEMRMYAASLPQLSVSWVELLIRHFEFTHALWRLHGQGGCSLDELHRLQASLRQAATTLSGKVSHLLCAR
jgi:hypothetical protein